MAGVPVTSRVLQGTVAAIGPDVGPDISIGMHVVFRRPEGELPELAFMEEELILAKIERPTYGE